MRRKNFLEIMLSISSWKARQQEKQARQDVVIQRIIFAGAILMVVLNLLLIIDVYLLPFRTTRDYVKDLTSLHTRGSVEEKLTTRDGRRLYMEYTSGRPGTPLSVRTTYIFDIVIDIQDVSRDHRMTRRMDGYSFARFFSFPFLLLGLLCLIRWKKLNNDAFYYFVPIPVLVTLQVFLFMI